MAGRSMNPPKKEAASDPWEPLSGPGLDLSRMRIAMATMNCEAEIKKIFFGDPIKGKIPEECKYVYSSNGDHKSKLPRPCTKSNAGGGRRETLGTCNSDSLKGKPKSDRSGNNSGQRYKLNKRQAAAACGMRQSQMEIQPVTLEVWPTTTSATAL